MGIAFGTLGARDNIIESYAKLVMAGKLDINKVPKKYRDAVEQYIAEHSK